LVDFPVGKIGNGEVVLISICMGPRRISFRLQLTVIGGHWVVENYHQIGVFMENFVGSKNPRPWKEILAKHSILEGKTNKAIWKHAGTSLQKVDAISYYSVRARVY
jgi:hypothetical protein